MAETNDTQLDEQLRRMLNESGYCFQYAVVAKIRNFRPCPWLVEAIEFPVTTRDGETHVDIVLLYGSRSSHQVKVVVECKRVNPAYSFWAFTHATRDLAHGKELIFDKLTHEDAKHNIQRKAETETAWAPLFEHGLTMPTKQNKETQILRKVEILLRKLFVNPCAGSWDLFTTKST